MQPVKQNKPVFTLSGGSSEAECQAWNLEVGISKFPSLTNTITFNITRNMTMLRGTQIQTGAQAAQYSQLINKIRDCLHPG
jgi:hypothetical protein